MARHAAPSRPLFGTGVRLIVVLLAVLGSGTMVWRASDAAFSATTSNSPNSWSAGQVAITDDDSTAAMFNVSGLKPGSTGFKCIAVTYTGNIASSVKLYATGYTGTLGTYLNLTIETSTVGSFSSCGAFSSPTTIYNGTLAGFVAASTSFGTGVGVFTPASNPTTLVYRFTYTLQDDNNAKNLSSTCGFTWEAQNT